MDLSPPWKKITAFNKEIQNIVTNFWVVDYNWFLFSLGLSVFSKFPYNEKVPLLSFKK